MRSSIQALSTENDLFSSTCTDLTLDPLPFVMVFMLFYMYWLDKRGHYMWWYFTCKHVSLFWNPLYYMYVFCKILCTMNILEPICYHTLFLRFLPVTSPSAPSHGKPKRNSTLQKKGYVNHTCQPYPMTMDKWSP